jgi:hypothetical protein
MIDIKIEVPDLSKILRDDKIDKVLELLAKRVRTRMIQSTPRDSGMAARSWTQPERIQFESLPSATFPVNRTEKAYSFGNTACYSHILERGSKKGSRPWPNVGPKTVEIDGQIYSSQAPGGMIESGQIERLVERALPDLVEKLLRDE